MCKDLRNLCTMIAHACFFLFLGLDWNLTKHGKKRLKNVKEMPIIPNHFLEWNAGLGHGELCSTVGPRFYDPNFGIVSNFHPNLTTGHWLCKISSNHFFVFPCVSMVHHGQHHNIQYNASYICAGNPQIHCTALPDHVQKLETCK